MDNMNGNIEMWLKLRQTWKKRSTGYVCNCNCNCKPNKPTNLHGKA